MPILAALLAFGRRSACIRTIAFVLGLSLGTLQLPIADARAQTGASAEPVYSGSIGFVRDPSGSLDADGFARRAASGDLQTAPGNHLNFGLTDDAIWLRLPLHNPTGVTVPLLIEIDYPFLDDVEFHIPDGMPGGPVDLLTGDRRTFETRIFLHRNFVLPVSLGPGESTEVHLRIRSSAAVQIPINVHTSGDFASIEQIRLLLLGAYFGVALAMTLYNLALYHALREPALLAYVAFVTLFGMFHLFLNGFGFQYLVPFSPRLGNAGAYLFLGPALAALGQFARSFLNSRILMPRLDRTVKMLIVLLALQFPAALLFDGPFVPMATQLLSFAGCCVAAAMGVVALRDGFAPARWYLLAFATVFLTGMGMILRNVGLLPWSPITAYGTQIGASLEALFLGLALSERIRTMARETLTTQKEALELARRTERNLESLVLARTAEIGAANAQLRAEITEREHVEAKLRDREDRLRRLAQHDPLTGVANRHLLADRGDALLSAAHQHGRCFGVVAIDLDQFKRVNDLHGHSGGDQVLVATAQRLSACLRGSDLLARIGGDEFIILLPEVEDREALAVVLGKLRDAFERPLQLGDASLVPRASFGGALYPDDGRDMDTLVRHADISMYGDKYSRRSRAA